MVKHFDSGSDNGNLFDERPMEIGGFIFRGSSAEPADKVKPTIQGWQTAMHFAGSAKEASPFWVGDLLNYAEGRADWREKLDQAKAVTGLEEQTLHQLAHVARKVQGKARAAAKSMSHAAEVAKLETEEEQVEWLETAKSEGWNHRELRVNIAASKRRKIIAGQAKLEGQYRVIYADPPWPYRDSTPRPAGSHTRATEKYPTMTMEDLAKLPVKAHALPNSVLFLWVPAPLLFDVADSRIVDAWGFTYKGGFVWDKVNGMPGTYNRVNHEHLLVCTRGKGSPDRPTPQPDSVFVEKRSDIHSAKPESVRHMIEKLYDGPYLELFGRKRVDGWTVFGNDASLWHQDVERKRA